MDYLGDADELGDDDIGIARRAGLLTPETCAISGIGLVFASLLTLALPNLLQLGVYAPIDDNDTGLLWLAAPGALLALAGALLGAKAQKAAMPPAMTGLSGAAMVVGSVVFVLHVIAYLRLFI